MPTFGERILKIIKMKSSCSSFLKDLQKVETINEGKQRITNMFWIIFNLYSYVNFIESKTFATLWYAHKLFPPQQSIITTPNGEKIRKRYSVADSQESFAMLATTSEELETKLKLLQFQGRSIQPRLLIIGDLYNIKKIYVYFDKLKFPCLSILEAFDNLFKLFFVFNLE